MIIIKAGWLLRRWALRALGPFTKNWEHKRQREPYCRSPETQSLKPRWQDSESFERLGRRFQLSCVDSVVTAQWTHFAKNIRHRSCSLSHCQFLRMFITCDGEGIKNKKIYGKAGAKSSQISPKSSTKLKQKAKLMAKIKPKFTRMRRRRVRCCATRDAKVAM